MDISLNKMALYKKEFLFGFIFLIYIILLVVLFQKNPINLMSNNSAISIVTSLFGGFILLMIYFFYKHREGLFYGSSSSPTVLSFVTKLFGVFFYLGITIALLVLIIYLIKQIPILANGVLFFVNIGIIIGILALAYSSLTLNKLPNSSKPTWMQLLIDLIFYVPCLLLQFVEFVKHEYKITTRTDLIVLGAEIALIALRFIVPIILKKIINQDGKQLLREPVYLNNENTLAMYDDFEKTNDNFNYNYSLSAWIFLDSQPSSTSEAYAVDSNLLNYGNKPQIVYNGISHKLKIKAMINDNFETVYEQQPKFQKWTNIFINYQGGTLDVFIDNKLVSSTTNVVSYMSHDSIVSGKINGINGGICNVMYYDRVLKKSEIDTLYNSQKLLNPPVI